MSESFSRFPDLKGIPDFWSRLKNSSGQLLALDYDGTLAPFHVERMKAVPLPGTPQILQALLRNGVNVAFCSGRPIQELRELIGSLQDVTMYGSHGHERLDKDGRLIEYAVPDPQSAGLRSCFDAARAVAPIEQIEKKLASVALHVRGIESGAAIALELRRDWKKIADRHNLSILDFNGGLEVRSTTRNKGTVMNELIDAVAPETFCVYIGDDSTDEDAFRSVKGKGVGIRVGALNEPTYAEGHLEDCAELLAHLQAWAWALRTKGGQKGEI